MGIFFKSIKLFASAIFIALLTIAILPNSLFPAGDFKFEPKAKKFLGSNLLTDVNVIDATLEQVTKLELDKQVYEPETLKFHNGFIYTGKNFNF